MCLRKTWLLLILWFSTVSIVGPVASLCSVCKTKQLLLQCFHCDVYVCEKCRIMHTREMRHATDAMLADLKQVVEERNLPEVQLTAMAKLDKEVGNMDENIDEICDLLTAAVDERRRQLHGEVKQYDDEERKSVIRKVDLLKSRIEKSSSFVDDSHGDAPLLQSDMIPIQDECRLQQRTLDESQDDVLTLNEACLRLTSESVLSAINDFGNLTMTGAPAHNMEWTTDVRPDDLKPDITRVNPPAAAGESILRMGLRVYNEIIS